MRTKILEAAIEILDSEDEVAITFESVARQAEVTKSGLMYHFPTKESLDLAIIDHVALRWEAALLDQLGKPLAEATPQERIRAYVVVAGSISRRSDFAASTEASYQLSLSGPWVEVFSRWFALPDDLPPRERARLATARYAADGLWYTRSTGGGGGDAEVASVIAEILLLLEPPLD